MVVSRVVASVEGSDEHVARQIMTIAVSCCRIHYCRTGCPAPALMRTRLPARSSVSVDNNKGIIERGSGAAVHNEMTHKARHKTSNEDVSSLLRSATKHDTSTILD